MALDTDTNPHLDGALSPAEGWVSRAQGLVAAVRDKLQTSGISGLMQAVLRRWRRSRLYRAFTTSIARRIFVSNIIGLAVLIGGILWLSQHQAWLITAKREALKVQGEIIAAAIAANPTIDRDRLTFEPDRLPEVEGPRAPYRDDAFAAYELSMRPDRVGPVLRRLIQPAQQTTRARIYDRDGELIADSHTLATGWGQPEHPQAGDKQRKVKVKTFWTRLASYLDNSDLPVYREIGTANGTYYSEVRQALKGDAPLPMLLLTDESKQIVSLAIPIQRRNVTLGALLLSTKPGEIDDIIAAERRIIYTLSIMALLTTLMASLWLTRTIAGPVRRLSQAADQVVSHSIAARADLPEWSDRTDEVGQMAAAFRRMTTALYGRIEASEKFAADVAHELRNPLTAAQSTAESLTYARTAEQREHCVTQIRAELKRLNRLITDVSNASRLDAELARQINEPVDMSGILTTVVDIFRDLSAAENIDIALDIDQAAASSGALHVKGHEGRLGQVVTNLVDNALSFSRAGGRVTVRARRVGGEVEFAVIDNGPGIPADKLAQIFERFYSDRPASDRTKGKNSGLGLSISQEIVVAHGGRIWAENRYADEATGRDQEPDKDPAMPHGEPTGARFTVRLPALQRTLSRSQMGLGWRP